MKIIKSAVLALLVICVGCYGQDSLSEQNDITDSLENALKVLACDAQLYAQLQAEVDKIAQEFDTSAEMRRRLQCCVTYKFDNLNQNFTFRENELMAIVLQQRDEIAELQKSYDDFKARAAQEIAELSQMVEVLKEELAASQNTQETQELQLKLQRITTLFSLVQAQYLQMRKERADFLAKLEVLANKAYGHFELEAIENNSFGDRICGTLYCPALDDQSSVEIVVTTTCDGAPDDSDACDLALTDSNADECPDKCFDLLLTGSVFGFFECVVGAVEDFVEHIFE